MKVHEGEPIPGLPENLPPGESIIVQARPEWRAFAIHVFHARKVAIYCAALIAWRIGSSIAAGKGVVQGLLDGLAVAPIAATCVLILVILAWAYARSSIYTITNRRLILRIGVSLPMSFNLPYAQIESAAVRLYRDGSGDIPVQLKGGIRLSYAHLWPHARPWQFAKPQPMLRALPDAARLAELLSTALRKANDAPASAVAHEPSVDRDRPEPLAPAVA
jgi:hypothetical protein